MNHRFSRSVRSDHDPYRLPIGEAIGATAFLLVLASMAPGWGSKLAAFVIIACVWVTVCIVALCDRRGKE
jgi:hypothetical protein